MIDSTWIAEQEGTSFVPEQPVLEPDEEVTTLVMAGSSRPWPILYAPAPRPQAFAAARPLTRAAPAPWRDNARVLQAAAAASVLTAMAVTATLASHVLERLSHRDFSAQILAVLVSTFVIAFTTVAAVVATSIVRRLAG